MIKKVPAKHLINFENASPPDFYQFRHRTMTITNAKTQSSCDVPLWIVGVSPFDKEIRSDSGYVMHIAEPKMIARWAIDDAADELSAEIKKSAYIDDELGIVLYEVSNLDDYSDDIAPWLLEAVCAVAYSKGLICEMEPPAEH